MKTAGCFGVILLLSLPLCPAVYAQGEAPASYLGRFASATDPGVEKAIEGSARLNEPKWKLSAHYNSSPATSIWEWKDGKREVRAVVSYLASEEDAAWFVKYTLMSVALPRYRPASGIGEEAYLIMEKGPILFRAESVAVHLSGHRVKVAVLRQFAERIAGAVRAA